VNATDTSTASGLDELFDQGVALSAEMRLPTQLFGRRGHLGMEGTWNSREYIALGQDPPYSVPNIKRPTMKSVVWQVGVGAHFFRSLS
jgi:porin